MLRTTDRLFRTIILAVALLTPALAAAASLQNGFVTIDLDGTPVDIHYLRAAPADPAAPHDTVLFFHGVPSTNALWAPVMQLLGDAVNVDAYAISFPGFGWSDAPAPASFDYREEGMNRVPFKAADALGIDRFFAVVHDVGGPWFICPAVQPEHLARLDGIIVLNSVMSPPGWSKFPPALRILGLLMESPAVPDRLIAAILEVVVEEGTASDVGEKYPQWVRAISAANSRPAQRLAIAKVIEEAAKSDLGFGGICWDSFPLLDVLDPLLVWAPEDPIEGDLSRLFLRAWPSAELIELSDALHFLSFDREQAIADAIAIYIGAKR